MKKWLVDGGEMGECIRTFDWSATSLGPIEGWPQSLRTAVSFMLDARQPIYIAWGGDHVSLYNDGYIPILGARHPDALGKRYADLWPEIRDEYRPYLEATMAGQAQYWVDQPVALAERADRPVSWFTFSWTPLRDETGAVAGFLCVATETTDKVLAEKHLMDSLDEGFCTLDVMFGEDNRAVDCRFVQANPAFEKQSGLADVPGKTIRQLVPGFEEHLIHACGQVALTGEPARFVEQSVSMGKWLDVYAFRTIGASRRIGMLFRDITAQKQAQQALAAATEEQQRHRRLYETVLSNTPDLVYVFDLEHRFAYANDILLRMWGKTWVEAIGKTCLELGYEQWHAEMHDREIEQVKATKRPIRGEVPFHGTFGRRIYDYIFVPVLGPGGEVEAIAGTTRDVTERKQFEEDLMASEQRAQAAARHAEHDKQRLDALLQSVPVAIGYADLNGKLFLVNAEYRRLWGNMPETNDVGDYRQWRGRWADGSARHGQLLQPHEWGMARALAGQEVKGNLLEIERFDAARTRRNILVQAAPVRDANGTITGAVVAQMDITEQTRIEKALRESEKKFRTITNAMPQMVWTALPDGAIDYHNERFYDFVGLRQGEAEGTVWADLVHADDRAAARDGWNRSVATGMPYEASYRVRHHSGQYRWILARALPVRDDAGAIIKWMGTDTDIHENKLTEEALQEAHRRKDEFLAMLAHELRNPLAPISAAADMLRVGGIDASRIRQYSDVIARQVDHMTTLVNDLLDVSRVTRGLVQLERHEVDIKTVVTSAAEQVRPLIEARQHELALRLGSAHATVLGDRTRLIQVVANLLANAAKYTPRGGQITLSVEVAEGKVRIRVTDNGSGIAPSLLPHVFDLFTQGERTPDRSQGGLGLGLALVKSIMAMHGGQADAHSEGAGRGSTFTVQLPVLAEQPPRARAEQTASAKVDAAPLRLMLVDDNPDSALMIADLLESAGHTVMTMHEPIGALAAAGGYRPDVFILDIGLPGIDGYELARRLRKDPLTARATYIALTGYGQTHDKVLAIAAGFDHHFIKPVDLRQLMAVLAQVDRMDASSP